MSANNGTSHPENGGTNAKSGLYDKQVFTTGEAAEVCKVSQQTIIRCFDAGRLNGFRVPGSRFRRIPRDELIRFMKNNEIPVENFAQGRKKILVVDDDPQIVDLMYDVLSQKDRFEVRTATTGYDAGVVSAEFKPDLMVLDYMLPDVNGNVVCETVRKNQDLRSMRIVVVSGAVDQEEIDRLLQAGADAFVKKPFDVRQLLKQIDTLLEVSKPTQA